MSAEFEPKKNKNEKQSDIISNNEDFSRETPREHPHFAGYGNGIEARLAAEPLSKEKKNELLSLANSTESNEATLKFVEGIADLTREQRQEFDKFRENISLLDLQWKDPKAFAEKMQTLSDEERNDIYNFERQEHAERTQRQQEIAERRANPKTEEDKLLAYSQKLLDPEGFKENYKGFKEQTKFTIFERGEDKRVKASLGDTPHITVPELTRDGEAWTVEPGQALADRAADIKSPEDYPKLQEVEAADPAHFSEIHRLLTPDQRVSYESQKKVVDKEPAEIFPSREPLEIAKGYEPVAFSSGRDRPMEGLDEWTKKAENPGVWSKVKRLFRRNK